MKIVHYPPPNRTIKQYLTRVEKGPGHTLFCPDAIPQPLKHYSIGKITNASVCSTEDWRRMKQGNFEHDSKFNHSIFKPI